MGCELLPELVVFPSRGGRLSWLSVPLQSMALYWLSSSFVGLLHNLLLRSPAFRRLCCIPRTPSDSATPYRDIANAWAAKLGRR